jgi:hypothetical protein
VNFTLNILCPQLYTEYSTRDVKYHASRSQNPPTYGYLYNTKEKRNLTGNKKAQLSPGLGLEAHRNYKDEVDRWCNDHCCYFGVLLAKLFHLILLKGEPVSRLLWLLADYSYIFGIDELLLYQVFLKVTRCTIALEGTEIHCVSNNPLDYELSSLLLTGLTIFHGFRSRWLRRPELSLRLQG